MRRFAKIELGEDAIPDETTILNFRHLLEEHKLSDEIFSEVRSYFWEKGSKMKQTKKGNQWYFGMKAHVGTDTHRGLNS